MIQRNTDRNGTTAAAGLALAILALFFIASCGQSAAPGSASFIDQPTGQSKRPWGMAFSQDNSRIYVANSSQHSISVIDADSLQEIDNIPTTCSPYRIALNTNHSKMYVSHDIRKGGDGCHEWKTTHEEWGDGSYLSIIDMSTGEITEEMPLTSVSDVRNIVYDTENDVVYITGSDTTNPGSCIIDGLTDAQIKCYSSTGYYSNDSAMLPNKIIRDYERSLMYIVDPANNMIHFRKPIAPRDEIFSKRTYNAQQTGYCLGSNLKNGCLCSSNSECASGVCDETSSPAYCTSLYTDADGDGKYPDGTWCETDSECEGGVCSSNTCMSYTMLNVNDFKGFCERDTGDCFETEIYNSPHHMADLGLCTSPWDVEVLSDDTAYVTCFGKFGNDDETNAETIKDPLLRVMWDTTGLATYDNAYITTDSRRFCDRPTEIASDPDGRFVFVLCFGSSEVLAIDISTGELQDRINVPSAPADIIVSNDYFFVTSAYTASIFKYPIADIPLTGAGRAQVLKLSQ